MGCILYDSLNTEPRLVPSRASPGPSDKRAYEAVLLLLLLSLLKVSEVHSLLSHIYLQKQEHQPVTGQAEQQRQADIPPPVHMPRQVEGREVVAAT